MCFSRFLCIVELEALSDAPWDYQLHSAIYIIGSFSQTPAISRIRTKKTLDFFRVAFCSRCTGTTDLLDIVVSYASASCIPDLFINLAECPLNPLNWVTLSVWTMLSLCSPSAAINTRRRLAVRVSSFRHHVAL